MESKLRGVKAIVEVQDELCWISKKSGIFITSGKRNKKVNYPIGVNLYMELNKW